MKTNVLEYLEKSVASVPGKCALVDDGKSYTYRQLDEARRGDSKGGWLCGGSKQLQRPLWPHSYPFSWRDKKMAAGGTQLLSGTSQR